MTAPIFVIVLALASCILSSHSDSQFINSKCNRRSYGSDSIVCVCTGSQCDKIGRITKPTQDSIVQITSSMEGLRFAKTKNKFQINNGQNPQVRPKIQVRRDYKFQEIIGFGGAFTDAATMNIKSLPKEAQEQLIRAYFAEDGLEYNMGRVPIGGTDFSTRVYSYADVPGDFTKNFHLKEEDLHYKIPLIQAAMSVKAGPDELFLSGAAWSSPPWMKTSNSYTGYGLLKDNFYQAYADYHLHFLNAYAKYGLKFWSISTGNEPLNGVLPVGVQFNSLGWTPSQQSAWIRNNMGPSLRNSVHNQTKLLALDDQRILMHFWLDWLLENKETLSYIDGIGIHWYTDLFSNAGVLDKTHRNFPNKFLLYTEACVGSMLWEHPKVILGSWSRAELLAEDMISVLNHWVTGWIDWNLALDATGGPNWAKNFVDSPIIVNATSGEFYKQPMFYILGHFSKFIPRGSVRIEAKVSFQSSSFSSIRKPTTITSFSMVPLTVAFQRPDGTIALVIMNKLDSPMEVELVDVQSGTAVLSVPSRSISTVLYG